jgi:hypothetical protein
MKFTFLFLLLANGLLFMWQSYFVTPMIPQSAPMPVDVPELVLLEETEIVEQDIDVVATAQDIEVASTEPGVTLPPEDKPADSFIDTAAQFVPAPKNCYTVGPFVDDGALKEVKQLFVENKITFQQRTLTKSELFVYNVFLPPFPSRDDAVAMVDVLIRKGITDYFILEESKLYNAISLGLFREYRYAVQHKKYLEKKGLSPAMRTRYYNRSRHWIDYTEQDNKIDETALVRMSPESDVQRLLRDCS